jgi:hypothetical protein
MTITTCCLMALLSDNLEHAAPVGTPWMWTLPFSHQENRSPTYGYAATREAAMAHWPRAGGGRNGTSGASG